MYPGKQLPTQAAFLAVFLFQRNLFPFKRIVYVCLFPIRVKIMDLMPILKIKPNREFFIQFFWAWLSLPNIMKFLSCCFVVSECCFSFRVSTWQTSTTVLFDTILRLFHQQSSGCCAGPMFEKCEFGSTEKSLCLINYVRVDNNASKHLEAFPFSTTCFAHVAKPATCLNLMTPLQC